MESSASRKTALPPGPPPRLFGLPPLALKRDLTGYLTALSQEHGDVVYIHFRNIRAYLINHPDLIRDVLVTQAHLFRKGIGLQRAKRLLGEGLLTSEGEFHLQQRRLLQPVFLKSYLRRYADAMSEEAGKTAARWRDGATVDMAREMTRLTLVVAGEALFSAAMEEQSGAIGAALDRALGLFNSLDTPLAIVCRRLPFGPIHRFHRARRVLDTEILKLITDRRQDAGEKSGDLLSLLLDVRYEDGSAMSDEQVRDEAMTIFLAGHETTANALAWTWFLLSQHPDVEARLHDEIAEVLGGRAPTYDDLEKLTYVRQVVAESMRLYSPVWALGRQPIAPYSFAHNGVHYTIPRGALVLLSQWVMHRDARFWDDPQRFVPERWAAESAAQRPRFAYFPFGGGTRQCMGEGFAWMEAILLLTTLAQRWKAHLAQKTPIALTPGITLRPRGGLKMRLERR